jgi:F-type H+-transporting ATPase subunit a
MKIGLFTLISSPLDQFEIRDLLTIDAPVLANLHISITNIGLYLSIGALLAFTINNIANNNNKIVSNN